MQGAAEHESRHTISHLRKKINKSAYDALKVELYKLHKRTPTAVRKERLS